MNRKIILGIGILIPLLALAGIASAHSTYSTIASNTNGCNYCHSTFSPPIQLTTTGNLFNQTHRFNGIATPTPTTSCNECHVDPNNTDFSMTMQGQNYSSSHRYNATTLASELLSSPGCGSCHVNVSGGNFTILSGTPTYLTSVTCNACHKAKYDNWTNTLHAVMLTPKDKAVAMNLPTPEVGWANISYVIVTKFQFDYINLTGHFLSKNDSYLTENLTFETSSHAGGRYGTCARCHTTGYNATGLGGLPGINGTFAEPGIACERCHKPAGNGHQVAVNYSGDLCRECHTGSNHGTDWENSRHAPPPFENGSNCVYCHSPFDKYKKENVSKTNAIGVSCGVCHNVHNMTDNKYAETFSAGIFNNVTWSVVANAKLGFFNATASIAARTSIFDTLFSPALLYPGTDSSRKDTSYGTAPINVTGPVSEVLCSKCHYRHGLAHIAGVNLTHSRNSSPQNVWATCTDCHMAGINASLGKDLMKKHSEDPLKDVAQSCGSATKCHTTSAQNLSNSINSIVPIRNEWNQSLHNDKVNGGFFENGTTDLERASSCSKCHSPVNWNPVNGSTLVGADAFRGITCEICHNVHDMGDWLKKTKATFGVAKAYAWYNRDAIVAGTNSTGVPTRYKANYTMMENTTELCGNCHANIREGRSEPGWASATATTPIRPHGFPAKDIFVGSWKQTSALNFECKDCHMYVKKTNATGAVLNDSEKITGHSFAVNETGLQNESKCNGCHDGTYSSKIPTVIEDIQTRTHNRWNTTNATVMNALNNIKLYTGEKNLSRNMIAQAYWKLRNVDADGSWGVHNPSKTDDLLNEASSLAIAANQSLGKANTTVQSSSSGSGSSSSGNGGSGGGGSGASGENTSNMEVIEKYDMQISKDVLTSYRFTHAKNPIMFVNITGNTSLGIITALIEVLKDTSTLVKVKPEGLVYKYVNIWVGTSGFATPKNIKEALIKFRIDNAWLSTNGVAASDIILVKWDGTNWINLETKVLSKDDTNTYFEGKTKSFSPFAITARVNGETVSQTSQISAEKTPVGQQSATPAPVPTRKTPGFELVFAIATISTAFMLRKRDGI